MKMIPRFLLLFSLLFAVTAKQETWAATGKVFVFRGRIQSVDVPGRKFTLQGDKKTYLFTLTDKTQITQHRGPQSFYALKPGQDAEVEMKIGPDGKSVALSVKIGSIDALEELLFTAITPSGKTLSFQQLKPLILHWYWPTRTTLADWNLKMGVLLLTVRGDGTVEKVEKLQSTGHPALDTELARAFMKWRFRPNSVKSVRVPVQYALHRW
jgi:TonB family protein